MGTPTWIREDANGEEYTGYPDKQTLNVMSKGVIWVYSVEAISLDDDVRFFNADQSGTTAGADQGRWATTAVSGKTTAVAGARWLSETSDAGLVLLEIDIPACTFAADT